MCVVSCVYLRDSAHSTAQSVGFASETKQPLTFMSYFRSFVLENPQIHRKILPHKYLEQ
ncbi:hypothetical protein ACWIUD_10550 [Helicobacter sp. 23-1044]